MNIATTIAEPTREQLVARAAEMFPRLRERAAACEADNKVADATIAEFQEAGFFKILQPRRFGGYEMDVETFYDVQMKVAEGCMIPCAPVPLRRAACPSPSPTPRSASSVARPTTSRRCCRWAARA